MSEPTQNLDVVTQGLGRLTSLYAKQPNVVAILTALLTPKQELENVLWDVYVSRRLRTATLYRLPATNVVLDDIGALIGQTRSGLSDADYQVVIFVAAATRRSAGRAPDWSKFAAILLAEIAGSPVYYLGGNAAFDFAVLDFPAPVAGEGQVVQAVAEALARAVPNGIRGSLVYSIEPVADSFLFGSVSTGSVGTGGLGSVSSPSTGRNLVAAQELV